MASEVEAYGVPATMALYDLQDGSNFAVFAGQGDKWRLKFSCLHKPTDEARAIFQQNLAAIDPNADATYQIRFYKSVKDGGEVTNNTDYTSSFNFKIKDKTVYQPIDRPTQQMQSHLSFGDKAWIDFLQNERIRLMDEVRELKDQLAITSVELEEALEDQEEPEDKVSGVIGKIGAIGEQYPWMQQGMGQLLGILDKITSSFTGGNMPGMATAAQAPARQEPAPAEAAKGIKETPEEISGQFQEAVNTLLVYYRKKYDTKGDAMLANDLAKLATLSGKPFIFDMAIKQLRDM